MKDFTLTNVSPSAAAAALSGYVAKPAAYATAIVLKGREYTEAVCAAINARTEDKPEERRSLYKVLAQAATRANAGFALQSRKHSGLSVTDAKPAQKTGSDATGDATTHKPGSAADKIATLSARLAESEAECKRLRAENDKLRAKLEKLAPARKPAARVARAPVAPVAAVAG